MYYKCELLVGGYAYAVTDCIKNWDDMTVSFKRNDYDGVVRSFTDKFEFVKGARQLILNEYKANYLMSNANIVVSTRNNSWTWTERFRCALDFSTLADDGFTLSINAVDDSVAALIKAKKGTQYEYSVDVVKDGKHLLYDRLEMDGFIKWVDGASLNEELNLKLINFPASSARATMALPFYVENSEIPVKNKIEGLDVSDFDYSDTKDMTPLLQVFEDMNVSLNLSMYLTNMGYFVNDLPVVYLRKYSEDGTISHISSKTLNKLEPTLFSYKGDISLKKGDSLKLFVENTSGLLFNLAIDFATIEAKFRLKGNPVYLSVVRPNVMLNRLLKSMNGGKDGLTGVIVPSGERRLDNALILAAESARQLPKAKIYSSFTKFANWMSSVFGYVYDINDKTVTFRPRKDYFGDSVVKEIKDFNGYGMKVNSSLIYSQVNVGYEKQGYDSVNGKDEFRFTNIYNTGITLTDNKLELISPYRADAYGIEFLTQKIGEDTTDNESDTGVFFVCAYDNGSEYRLDRDVLVSGVISPSTMFNAMYAPTSMIDANADYLGGFVSELDYASSEGNTSVIIDGKVENRDIKLSGGLFTATEVEVETSDVELPEDMTGIVSFEYQGEEVRGYYLGADFCYTKTKSSKLTLAIKKTN